MKICVVENCSDEVRAKNLCSLHYGRWVVSGKKEVGPSQRVRQRAEGQTCSEEGCDSPVRCKMLCARHYSKARNSSPCPTCGGVKARDSVQCAACRSAPQPVPESKICTKCLKDLPIEKFGWRRSGNTTCPRARCRDCETDDARKYRESLPPEERKRKKAEAVKKARERNDALDPEIRVFRSIRASAKTLGLDPVEVAEAFKANGNVCQACGMDCTEGPRVHIDHCHQTGEFRGFLCNSCNIALGHTKDDVDRLRSLIVYLESTLKKMEG